jgi:hypothetical protein
LIGWRKTGHNQRRERGALVFPLGGLARNNSENLCALADLLAAALVVLISSATMLTAAETHHDAPEKLATVSFPISCSAEGQQLFERGVALLHSFLYDQADKQFKQVADADPQYEKCWLTCCSR